MALVMKKRLKSILLFTILVLTVPPAGSLLFGFWLEADPALFYPNARSLFIICYVIKNPLLHWTFKPQGKVGILGCLHHPLFLVVLYMGLIGIVFSETYNSVSKIHNCQNDGFVRKNGNKD